MSVEPDLTVAELITALYKFPPEAIVYTEGCDCTGTVGSVSLDEENTVFLWRPREIPVCPTPEERKRLAPRIGNIMEYKGTPVLVKDYSALLGTVLIKYLAERQAGDMLHAELWVPWDAVA